MSEKKSYPLDTTSELPEQTLGSSESDFPVVGVQYNKVIVRFQTAKWIASKDRALDLAESLIRAARLIP